MHRHVRLAVDDRHGRGVHRQIRRPDPDHDRLVALIRTVARRVQRYARRAAGSLRRKRDRRRRRGVVARRRCAIAHPNGLRALLGQRRTAQRPSHRQRGCRSVLVDRRRRGRQRQRRRGIVVDDRQCRGGLPAGAYTGRQTPKTQRRRLIALIQAVVGDRHRKRLRRRSPAGKGHARWNPRVAPARGLNRNHNLPLGIGAQRHRHPHRSALRNRVTRRTVLHRHGRIVVDDRHGLRAVFDNIWNQNSVVLQMIDYAEAININRFSRIHQQIVQAGNCGRGRSARGQLPTADGIILVQCCCVSDNKNVNFSRRRITHRCGNGSSIFCHRGRGHG